MIRPGGSVVERGDACRRVRSFSGDSEGDLAGWTSQDFWYHEVPRGVVESAEPRRPIEHARRSEILMDVGILHQILLGWVDDPLYTAILLCSSSILLHKHLRTTK